MRTSVSRLIVVLAAIVFGISAAAEAGPLSGTVRDQSGNPIPFASVEVLHPSTGESLASDATTETGSYFIDIADNNFDHDGDPNTPPITPPTYNVRVTPTPASGFTPATAFGIFVSGPTTLDFSLASATTVTFTGRILDLGGAGIENQSIQLFPEGSVIGVSTTTDSTGTFSFDTQTGSYVLVVNGDNQGFVAEGPQFYVAQTAAFNLTADLTIDFTLPVKRVTVHVEDGGGSPVVGATLSSTGALNCELMFGPYAACGASSYDDTASPNATTDGSGNVVLFLFPTPPSTPEVSYTLTATPPAASTYAPGSASGVRFTADTAVTIVLNPPTVLSGRLLDGLAAGIPNQSLQLIADGQESGVGTMTDTDGSFTFSVQPGTYRLQASGDNQGFSAAAPQSYTITSGPFSVSTSQVKDFQLPVKQVSVHVQDGGGTAVQDTGLSTTAVSNCALSFGSTTGCGASNYTFDGSTGMTDGSGNITLWLFPTPAPDPPAVTSYRFTATPPAGSGLATTTVSNITFSANTTVTITLATPVHVTGQLRDRASQGIANQFFEFVSAATGAGTGVITDADGNYSAALQPGDYSISAFGDNQNFAAAAPQFYFLNTANFTVPGTPADQVLNLTVPVKRLDVHVQDGSNNPIANVGFSAAGPTNCTLTFGPALACGNSQYFYVRPGPGQPPPPVGVTNAAGDMTLWLFPTPAGPDAYDLTATPLSDSGFEQASVAGVSLSDDASLVIVLNAAHASPVTTLAISPAANPDGTYPDPVTITLSATAAAGFTVDTTFYEVDDTGVQQYVDPFQVAGPGPHSVRYFSVDNDGVSETPKTFNFEIAQPDTSGPVTTATVTPDANAAGWHNTDVSVQLHAEDEPGGTGVANITYEITGAQATPMTVVGGDTANISITTEGVSEITFFATDNSGNPETPAQTLTIRVDKTAPEAYTQFDPAGKDLAVFGSDPLSGAPAGAVAPSSVVSGGPGVQIRTYDVTDNAGNVTQLVVRVQKGAKQLTAQIQSIKYGSGPVMPTAANAQTFNWTVRGDGTLNRLEQVMSAVGHLVDADFVMPSNRTKITRWLPLPVVRETRVGLTLLRTATSNGNLSVEY